MVDACEDIELLTAFLFTTSALEHVAFMFANFIIHLNTLFRNVIPRDASIFVFDAVTQNVRESRAFCDIYKGIGQRVFVPEVVADNRA